MVVTINLTQHTDTWNLRVGVDTDPVYDVCNVIFHDVAAEMGILGDKND